MDDVFILNENGTDAARLGLQRLHDAVVRRESSRPEAALSPDELLVRTYAAGGYRLEDLSKVYDTLAAFARLRGQLPNTATIDGETRNPRKLGSHTTLASLWTVIAPFIEAERLSQEDEAGEKVDADKERALSQSRVLHRSNRMVVAVPMTQEASCWWGKGTQWCTAARKNNAFEQYHSKAPLIVVCLRKSGDLLARKLQLHAHAGDMQFMDENDARVSPELISERWEDFEALLHWAVGRNGEALKYVPEHLCTEDMCLAAVGSNGLALKYVPDNLCTEAVCLAAVTQFGRALSYIPEPLRTEAVCTAAVEQNGLALFYVPELLRTEAICTAAVGINGWALEYVPEPLRTEAICLAAATQDGWALLYVPEHLCTKAVCLAAVTQNGFALGYVPKSLRTEEICTVAANEEGEALYHVPKLLRTEAMCLAAVGRNGQALQFVPETLCTEAMCLAAVTQDGAALTFVPEPLRTEALCLAAVTQDGAALTFVPEPLRTEALCLAAVSRGKLKSVSVIDETNEWELHDLVLESLENCLNDLYPTHQNTSLALNLAMHQ